MASGSRQTTRRAVGARSCVHSAEQIYCPQEGVWETTLAGLTIPGPCRTGQFGQSSRTCRVNGEWENVDYSDCYDMGCRADAEWTDSPIRTTLMRMCPAGIYRMELNGSHETMLTSDSGSYISYLDGFIYFRNVYKGQEIYRINEENTIFENVLKLYGVN